MTCVLSLLSVWAADVAMRRQKGKARVRGRDTLTSLDPLADLELPDALNAEIKARLVQFVVACSGTR